MRFSAVSSSTCYPPAHWQSTLPKTKHSLFSEKFGGKTHDDDRRPALLHLIHNHALHIHPTVHQRLLHIPPKLVAPHTPNHFDHHAVAGESCSGRSLVRALAAGSGVERLCGESFAGRGQAPRPRDKVGVEGADYGDVFGTHLLFWSVWSLCGGSWGTDVMRVVMVGLVSSWWGWALV